VTDKKEPADKKKPAPEQPPPDDWRKRIRTR
jgi:hypothetical protein